MIFIFPGQGSQMVGMGKDIYDNFAVARDVFHEVNHTLNKNLSRLIFEGPSEILTMTENAQPALMTVSIAILRTIEFLLGKSLRSFDQIKYLAGHSVGECTALCASGAIDLQTTAKLLYVRGAAMYKAFPEHKGGMVALICCDYGQDLEDVIKYAQKYGKCEIANDNGGGQIVVSGTNEALDELQKIIKNTTIKKAIRLHVSGPFHSSLMHPACDVVKDFIRDIEFSKPCLPIISNVSACEMLDSYMIKDLLIQQIVSRVRWRESVLYAISKGCRSFIEIGSSNVLTKLVRRIDNTVYTMNINSLSAVDDLVEYLVGSPSLVCS